MRQRLARAGDPRFPAGARPATGTAAPGPMPEGATWTPRAWMARRRTCRTRSRPGAAVGGVEDGTPRRDLAPLLRRGPSLDAVDLVAEFQRPIPTLQDVPVFMRAGVRRALTFSLRALRDAYAEEDGARVERAWKLFLLTPRMLLARPESQGAVGRQELLERLLAFERGDWVELLTGAQAGRSHARGSSGGSADARTAERRREAACTKVRRGELSRARQLLTAAELAPGNAATLAALIDPSKRPPTARDPIPAGVMEFQPASPVRLPDGAIARALKDAKRGSAPGLSGARVEHYKLLLDDADSLGLLSAAATRLARAQLPPAIARAHRGCVPPSSVPSPGRRLGRRVRRSHPTPPVRVEHTIRNGCAYGPAARCSRE